MTPAAETLRRELQPSGELEEMFFSQIVNLSILASYLMRHLEADPHLLHKETPRWMRMLASNQRQARYAYEELRRLQLARQMCQEDPELAEVPLLAIVARNTNRNGFRVQRRATTAPSPVPVTRPVVPGRNAQCPCNSGLKYKRCCANKQQAA